MNADGWGVGWWAPEVRAEPARYRTAMPMWTDRSFRSVAEVVHAEALVAAVRSASPPSPIVETGNAPFTTGPWLFSLNGFVTGFRGPVGETLRREVSELRSVAIEGTTDSEVLFALVLDRLDAGCSAPAALAAVVGAVSARAEGKVNLLLSDGDTITATTFGNSLFTLADRGLAAGGVLVSSEPLDDDEGWTRVADHMVVEARIGSVAVSPLSSHGGPA
jgi:glutamine amidotransferase